MHGADIDAAPPHNITVHLIPPLVTNLLVAT